MAKKRERLEVIYDMLKSVDEKKKIKPTNLIFASNLSPQMFKKYKSELIEKNLIKEEKKDSKKYFVLTDKGRNFLMEYKQIKNLIEDFGL